MLKPILLLSILASFLFANIPLPNNTTSNSYDISGNQISTTNQNGDTTRYYYDTYNRLVKVVDPLGNATTYTYDTNGNKLTQVDALQRVTQWRYDVYGSLISRTLPMGEVESVEYDDLGRVSAKIDFNGYKTTYRYDINDNIQEIVYDDTSKEIFAYNTLGNKTSIKEIDVNGNVKTTTYSYDSMQRLIQENKPDGSVLKYTYDNNGNLISQTTINPLSQEYVTTYSYDALNRLIQVVSNDNQTTTYTYDAVGNLSSIEYSNGNHTYYTYDSLNHLIKLEHTDKNDETLSVFEYTLSPTAQRLKVKELDKITTYTYDKLNRLLSQEIENTTQQNYQAIYSYDAVSNMIESTIDGVTTQYSYDDNDRLLQQGGITYTYDNNGNLLTQTIDGMTTTYTYNTKNQLIKREDDKHTIYYTYDSNGIRDSKTIDDNTTLYVVDDNTPYAQVLQEITDDKVVVSYTYGNDLISQTRDDKTTIYHYDGLGSARYLSDENGEFTDSYDYEAFGKLLNKEGNTTNNYLYTGEQFDSETDNYYLRARYYSPQMMRFTQMDSYMGNSQDPISLHKYLYANANPVLYTDPTGHFSMMETSLALDVKNTLANVQFESYNTLLNVVSGGGWDGSLEDIPEMAGTALGLRLLLRFNPALRSACKNSFTAGTLVATANGLVPIEDIKIGDKVWAYNETNQTKSLQEVTHLIRGEGNKTLTDITLDSGEVITATSNHPFWAVADHNWTEAGELTLDNILLNINEYNTTISNLTTYTKEDVVYNLTVANDHTYFVGRDGVLGHNAGCDWNEAVNNLGISGLTYNNGTAYITIGTTEAFNIKDVRTVKKMMKALGNSRLEVETGMLANENLLNDILQRFKNNKPFMGGKIERSKSGISDFVIKFDL